MTIDFNVEPYHDDYVESKNFHRILFRPGYSVQARELTQLQTILQKQIQRHGSHIFKEGSMVIPGSINLDRNISHIKLTDTVNPAVGTAKATNSVLSDLIGKTIVGMTTGVEAVISQVAEQTETDPPMIFVKYTKTSTDGTQSLFNAGEKIKTIEALPNDEIILTIKESTTTDKPFGNSSAVSISAGVYYTNGFFVYVNNQTIILDKWSAYPTYKIGLDFIESIVGPEDDETLLDNAQNSYNYAAPGAHRYSINAVLTKRGIGEYIQSNFIELLRVVNGNIEYIVNRTDYAILEDNLARRTYDESGNYTVTPFGIDVREYRNNYRGTWNKETAYLTGDIVSYQNPTTKLTEFYVSTISRISLATVTDITAADELKYWEYTNSPNFNRGVNAAPDTVVYAEEDTVTTKYVLKTRKATLADNESVKANLAVGVTAGKAYIFGYEIEKLATNYVTVPKARDTNTITDAVQNMEYGCYVLVTNLHYLPDVTKFQNVNIYNETSDIGGIKTQTSTLVGTAKIVAIQLHSGSQGSSDAVFKLFLTNINMSENAAGDLYDFDVSAKQFLVEGVDTNNRQDWFTANRVLSLNIPIPLFNPTGSSLLFPIGVSAVKTVDRFRYYITKTNTASSDDLGVLSLTTSEGEFASEEGYGNYIITNIDTGKVVNIQSSGARSNSNKTISFTGKKSKSYIIQYTLQKENKIKTKTRKTNLTEPIIIPSQEDTNSKKIFLGKADCVGLLYVTMNANGFQDVAGDQYVDITNRFDLFDGQTQSYYGESYIMLKDKASQPTGTLKIAFSYYQHGADGDYFTVDSYPDYENIPYIQNTNLRDCIDFRPIILASDVKLSPPRFDIDGLIDYKHYLPRKSIIAMSKTGQLKVVNGISDVNPKEPADLSDCMTLYKLSVNPYTFSTDTASVVTKQVDNKRYTMRDIGKLEGRINQLEYYTSLSLLEQDTVGMTILDENGLDRYKNGFIVDNFTSQSIGDTNSPDYMCSVDMKNGILRPFYTMDSIEFVDIQKSNADRLNNGGYVANGDLITLPFDEVLLVNQEMASQAIPINENLNFTFNGTIKITPPFDRWFDTERRPDVVVEVEGSYNAIKTLAEKAGVLGTVYGAWETTWTGEPQTTSTSTTETIPELANRSVTTNTITAQVGQTRSATLNTINEQYSKTTIDDKVVSTTIIPYVRSRNILINASGLKPKTIYYPFFDKVGVDNYCLPADVIVIDTSKAFDKTFNLDSNGMEITNVGSDYNNPARTTGPNPDFSMSVGDVIEGLTSGSTAVVVGSEYYELSTGVKSYKLYVVNFKQKDGATVNTFKIDEQIKGSISGAKAFVASHGRQLYGSPIVTNETGSTNLILTIPNNDALRFRTGKKEFALMDTFKGVYSTTLASSTAFGSYEAEGYLEAKQATVQSVRNAEIVTSNLDPQTQTLTNTSTNTTYGDWITTYKPTVIDNTVTKYIYQYLGGDSGGGDEGWSGGASSSGGNGIIWDSGLTTEQQIAKLNDMFGSYKDIQTAKEIQTLNDMFGSYADIQTAKEIQTLNDMFGSYQSLGVPTTSSVEGSPLNASESTTRSLNPQSPSDTSDSGSNYASTTGGDSSGDSGYSSSFSYSGYNSSLSSISGVSSWGGGGDSGGGDSGGGDSGGGSD